MRRKSKVVARGTLNARGRIDIRLPRQKAGSKKFRVVYLATANTHRTTRAMTNRFRR